MTPDGNCRSLSRAWAIATGLAFDVEGNLFVGDRSGTIFKISPTRQIFVFATLEPSISAYHLAFGPDGYLYVTGPTTPASTRLPHLRSRRCGDLLSRSGPAPRYGVRRSGPPVRGRLLAGRRGVVRITPDQKAELFLSGPGIVGLAFTPSKALAVATTNALYRVDVGIKGACSNGSANRACLTPASSPYERRNHRSRLGDCSRPRAWTPIPSISPATNNLGVEVVTKYVVGDDRDRLASTIRAGRVQFPDRAPERRPRAHRRRRDARCPRHVARPAADFPPGDLPT